MIFKRLNKSDGSLGALIVGGTLIILVTATVIFATKISGSSGTAFSAGNKYPAKAFVITRQGSQKSRTTYTGIAAGKGMSVDVNFDESDRRLNLKIKDRTGNPMPRVTIDARANKVGRPRSPKRFAMTEFESGEYRSDTMDLEKGGWILAITAYDLYNRGDNKLLFHTEKPLFLK